MVTKLTSPLRRELPIGKIAYVVTIDPDGMKLVPKGRRKGFELAWRDLVSGDAAMAIALRASLSLPKTDAKRRPKSASKKDSAPAAQTPAPKPRTAKQATHPRAR